MAINIARFAPYSPRVRSTEVSLHRASRRQLFSSPSPKVGFVGLGHYGTALLHNVHKQIGFEVTGYLRTDKDLRAVKKTGSHPRYFSDTAFATEDARLPRFTTDLGDMAAQDLIILACPSKYALDTIEALRAAGIPPEVCLLSVVKGFVTKNEAPIFVSTALREAFPENPIAYMGGPSFASGVIANKPTVLTVTGIPFKKDTEALRRERGFPLAVKLSRLLYDPIARPQAMLRINPHPDAIAVQLGGALKNIVAIASGFTARLLGDFNSQVAIVQAGIAEIETIGILAGAKTGSFLDQSVVGDAYLTGLSDESRNYRVGWYAADVLLRDNRRVTEKELSDYLKKEVAEGYYTSREFKPVLDLLLPRFRLPIHENVYEVLHGEGPLDAARLLNKVFHSAAPGFDEAKKTRDRTPALVF